MTDNVSLRRAIILSIVILAIGICVCVVNPELVRAPLIPDTTYGVPVIYDDTSPAKQSGIEQILEYQNHLYLLDDAAGTIAVFDYNGNYIESIAFYITSINGAFQMAVQGNCLYVCDKSSNVYVFRDGMFADFVESDEAGGIRRLHDFSISSDKYVAFLGSVWQKSEEGFTCFVQNAYQGIHYGYWFLAFSLLPIVIATIRLRKSKANRKGQFA